MKPSWKGAPEWAKYRAKDNNGAWYWYEYKPVLIERRYQAMTGRCAECDVFPSWRDTLEKRP